MTNIQEVARIENNFTYHAPSGTHGIKYQALRDKAKELALLMVDLVPDSRERSLALTNLEQACFWANAGIARNEREDYNRAVRNAASAADAAVPYNFMHRLSEEGLIEREGPEEGAP